MVDSAENIEQQLVEICEEYQQSFRYVWENNYYLNLSNAIEIPSNVIECNDKILKREITLFKIFYQNDPEYFKVRFDNFIQGKDFSNLNQSNASTYSIFKISYVSHIKKYTEAYIAAYNFRKEIDQFLPPDILSQGKENNLKLFGKLAFGGVARQSSLGKILDSSHLKNPHLFNANNHEESCMGDNCQQQDAFA